VVSHTESAVFTGNRLHAAVGELVESQRLHPTDIGVAQGWLTPP